MIKKLNKTLALMLKRIKAVPRVYWLASIAGLSVVAIAVYMWPQSVTFSYNAASTCIGHPTVAPSVLKSDSQAFKMVPSSVVQVASVDVAARGVCFMPLTAPQPGDYKVTLSLPGLSFIQKNVTIHVPSHPVASAAQLKEPIPLSKKLIVELSREDTVFSYHLTVGDKSVKCESAPLSVGCDISSLGLQQGAKYSLKLERYYQGKKLATILEAQIETLSAVALVSSSIKQGEVVYTKPKSLTLLFDKTISDVDVPLVRANGDKKQVATTTTVKGKELVVAWTDELARESVYEIVLKRVEASDGSRLATPPSISFTTSGGPKVKGISVGGYKVPLGASVTITFDQPLSEQQDIASVITASGGARVVGRQGQTVTLSFANVPRCSDVIIKITNDLKSNNDISGGSAWQFATRTLCQLVGSIGTSVKGRSITSYTIGSGPKVVVYTGAIHGDETSTRSLMLRWVDYLEANVRSIPADKRVVVIPSINPDGFAAGTRTNARNVDLNRNFDTSDWKSDITNESNAPFPGGGGASPLSEPESAAIAAYIDNIRPSLIVSYHSIGGLLMANQVGSSLSLARTYSSLSGYGNSTGSSTGETFGYSVTGTAEDYYGEKLGLASVLIELGSHTYHQFERNQKAMLAVLRDA